MTNGKKDVTVVLAHQDGIHLPTAETRQQGGQRTVVQAMRDASEVWMRSLRSRKLWKNRNPANFRLGPLAMTAA